MTCKELGCKSENCEGHWTEEFISCGPKNYSFRVNTGEIVCKVRGFSLNYRSSLNLNFQSMKDCLYAWKEKKPLEMITVKLKLEEINMIQKFTIVLYPNIMESYMQEKSIA